MFLLSPASLCLFSLTWILRKNTVVSKVSFKDAVSVANCRKPYRMKLFRHICQLKTINHQHKLSHSHDMCKFLGGEVYSMFLNKLWALLGIAVWLRMFLSQHILSVFSVGEDLLADIDSESMSDSISAESTEQHDVTVRDQHRVI